MFHEIAFHQIACKTGFECKGELLIVTGIIRNKFYQLVRFNALENAMSRVDETLKQAS